MTADAQTSEARAAKADVEGACASWGKVCRRVGRISLLLAIAVPVVASVVPGYSPDALSFTTVVLGAWIPTWWGIEAFLLVLGIVALIAAFTIAPEADRPHRALRMVLTGLLIVGALIGAAVIGLRGAGEEYRLLPEQSADGCRIAVREYSFMFAGGGDVGIVRPGGTTVEWIGSYGADDGYKPFSSGTYSVDWRGEMVTFAVWGEPGREASWGYE
jgi:hypothetical protein